MKKIAAFFRDGTAEEWMGRVMVILVIVPVIINIFSRVVLQHYSTTLEAIALSAYVWIGYAGFGYLYKKDAHVDVKFIQNLLPPIGQQILDILRDIFIFVFSAFITYWGLKLCKSGLTRMVTGTKIAYFFPYLSIVVGFFSGAVRSLWSLLSRIFKGIEGRKTE
ncbi:TRAP transporter small permease [Oscillospiraceae bacterium LTW-04]|nr:TRAP transporter small permease subunit [Oscillospiraceae bacterium MB24-C1]